MIDVFEFDEFVAKSNQSCPRMSQVAEGLLHDVQFGIESRFIAGTVDAVFEAAKL